MREESTRKSELLTTGIFAICRNKEKQMAEKNTVQLEELAARTEWTKRIDLYRRISSWFG